MAVFLFTNDIHSIWRGILHQDPPCYFYTCCDQELTRRRNLRKKGFILAYSMRGQTPSRQGRHMVGEWDNWPHLQKEWQLTFSFSFGPGLQPMEWFILQITLPQIIPHSIVYWRGLDSVILTTLAITWEFALANSIEVRSPMRTHHWSFNIFSKNNVLNKGRAS